MRVHSFVRTFVCLSSMGLREPNSETKAIIGVKVPEDISKPQIFALPLVKSHICISLSNKLWQKIGGHLP